MIKDSCCVTSKDFYPDNSYQPKYPSMNQYLLRQVSAPSSATFPSMSLPFQKVLETVCYNCQLGSPPLIQSDYLLMLADLSSNEPAAETNIASILRSLTEHMQRDRALQTFMFKELEFCPERRIFKNSALYLQDDRNLQYLQDSEEVNDIGTVKLYDFMIKFGQLVGFLPDKLQKAEDMIKNAKPNLFLQQATPKPFKRNSLLSAINSQEDGSYLDTNSQMMQDFQQQMIKTGTDKLLEGTKPGTGCAYNQSSQGCVNLEANESLDLFQQQQQQMSPFVLKRPTPHHGIKQSEHFNFIHTNVFSKLQTPNGKKTVITTTNNNTGANNVNPQHSFMNLLRSSDKGRETFMGEAGFKKVGESVISANNSLFNTPLHNHSKFQHSLYPNMTEQKQSAVNRNLFSSSFYSPFKSETKHYSHIEFAKKHNLIGSLQSLGKRQPPQEMDLQSSAYQTPPYKRIKLEDNVSVPVRQQQQQQQQQSLSDSSDSDEENNGNNDDPNNSASRKKRGLKILSVKVQELVQKRQKTTYKDVANELIEQLRKNSEMQELTGFNDDEISDEDDEDSSVDTKSPSKRRNGTDKKSQLQKWEKNVRRRVYDALNVLYAAGVLKKEGKHVFCDNKAIQLGKKLKEAAQDRELHQQKQITIPQDGRFLQNLENLRTQVEQIKNRVEEKREMLADQVKHYLSYKHLIQRNQQLEQSLHGINKQRVLNLPFILVSTKDSPENEVDITYEDQMTFLNIAIKMPFKCFGDADTLMQLGMYKVDSHFFNEVVPEGQQILKCLFERELKAKLSQKSTVHSTEEATLLKAFKYFDLDNNGTCEPEEFAKALEKLGVVIPTKRDLDALFKYYDTDNSGALDYKEFSAVITGNAQSSMKPERQNAVYGQGLGTRPQAAVGGNTNEVLDKVRTKLASRGARGIIGMGKQFKIFDDDNSRSLDQYEFKKAMTEQRLGLSDADIITLFNAFDRNRDGSIDYDEFVRVLRGPMSNYRKKLVQQAFNKLDRDGSGEVDMNDIKDVYNAKRHPDVVQGKRTEEEVLYEFLQTFQMHHNTINSQAPDNIVTREEFEEYYNNISSSIDNDQYFELMINNAWKINEGDRPQQKAWAADTGSKSVSQQYGSRPQTGKPAQQDDRFQTTSKGYGTGPMQKGSSVYSQTSTKQGQQSAIEKLRQRLASRGARGFIGMQKQFKIMDDNNSGTIDMQEFRKAVKDFRIDLNDQEIRDVFAFFDRDSSGSIDYDEFVRGVRGPMNAFRQKIVKAAFQKIDADGSGVLDLNDIKGVYNAKSHPLVKSGKKTEDEILGEFLETFEMHHALNGGGVRDRSVTVDEFMEYYNNVSASIDNDQYFELMMMNAWKLHGEAPRKPAWTNVQKDQNVYEKGFNVTRSAPYGVDSNPTDYSTNLRPRTQQQQTYQQYPAAGSSSWAVKQDNITGSNKAQNPQQNMSYSEKQLLEIFSSKLASRGARGIIGLQKQFKIADDDRSHDLDQYEFKKAIKDFRVPVQDKDIDRLFNIFDRDRSGRIDYDEFLRGVRGEMNSFRRNLAEKAFRIMDRDKSGTLNIDDIKGVYNGKMHPDVKAGKKTEDEILGEFLDTFELHYSLNHENSKDRQISLDEWIEYYNNVSMSIDDDKYFELMMNSAWNLDGSRVTKKGWGGEF